MRETRAIRDLATPMIVPHLLQTAGEFAGDWALPAANPTAIDKRRRSFDEQEFSRPEIDRRRRVDPVTDFALIRT
jgi:hypothetical protein